jgi:hypothetical protein
VICPSEFHLHDRERGHNWTEPAHRLDRQPINNNELQENFNSEFHLH